MILPSRDIIQLTIDRSVALAASSIKSVVGGIEETAKVSVKIAPVVGQAAYSQCEVFVYVMRKILIVLKKFIDLAIELWCFVAHVCNTEYAIACEFSSEMSVIFNG
jgi:hypothetical protein